jgi:hypothetical protein
VDRIFGASVDAVLLAATVIGPLQHSHLILRFEARRPAGSNAKATAPAEFLNNRWKPFERVFVLHDFLGAAPSMKCRFADEWHRDRRHSKQK